MKTFQYRKEHGSFKSWLLQLTRWRIVDQVRKRQKNIAQEADMSGAATSINNVENVADPATLDLDKNWNEEWEQTLLKAAITRVKKRIDPKHYQIFELHVVQRWPVSKVAKATNCNPARIYLIKHRVGRLIKEEVKYLETIDLFAA
jgi:RNA polymerase sigma factor (sigma-70 family)